MAQENTTDIIRRYLQDCIAAEKNFEDQLSSMSKEGEQTDVQRLFAQHADETKTQYERLTVRLKELGGSPSTVKSFMAHLLGYAPKSAQLGQEDAEKNTQDLIMAYAVEHSEIAMYEALATVATAGGDSQTERLARQIQQEERRAAEKVWNLLATSARDAFDQITTKTRTA